MIVALSFLFLFCFFNYVIGRIHHSRNFDFLDVLLNEANERYFLGGNSGSIGHGCQSNLGDAWVCKLKATVKDGESNIVFIAMEDLERCMSHVAQ